jgi:hyperosmotically inducible periplasmic protein
MARLVGAPPRIGILGRCPAASQAGDAEDLPTRHISARFCDFPVARALRPGLAETEAPMIRSLIIGAALVLAAGGGAQAQAPRKDLQVFKDVAREVTTYPNFTVFDDVSATVEHGAVTLRGKVTMGYKADEIERRVAKIPGVSQVRSEISVLPTSFFDDDLRYRIARSIYGNPAFWQYASMANPPIHIVVENGHVTLTGVVNNNVERVLAGSLASSSSAFSVKDELKTDVEMRAALEKLD